MGAPGAEDGCQRHLALGALLRAGAAADLAADNQMAQAALGRVVVRRRLGLGHEDEEFLDVVLDASAQLGLGGGQRVSQEGLADGQQASFQGQLGTEESEVLFTLIAERYERRSLGITSNLVFSEWERIFANPMATAAAIDRVVHHSVILEFDVPSYRTNAAQQRVQAEEVNRQI